MYNICSKDNPTYNGDRCADGIYVDGGKDIVIERNTVDNCDIGVEIASEHSGKTTSGITVRNNFVSRSFQGSIMSGGYAANKGNAANIVIVNNTLYFGNDGEIVLQHNNSDITIKNNICYAKSGARYLNQSGKNNTNITVDNNLYFGASTSSPGDFNDAHAKYVNPELAGPPANMHLTATSKAVNAGAALSADILGLKDIDGEQRVFGAAVDIGADEYTGISPLFHTIQLPQKQNKAALHSLIRQAERVCVYSIGGKCVYRSIAPISHSLNNLLSSAYIANGVFIIGFTINGEPVNLKWVMER